MESLFLTLWETLARAAGGPQGFGLTLLAPPLSLSLLLLWCAAPLSWFRPGGGVQDVAVTTRVRRLLARGDPIGLLSRKTIPEPDEACEEEEGTPSESRESPRAYW